MQNLKTKDVVTYCTMPRVVPRLKGLFSSGFGYVAFLMAHIYCMVRILPDNHPYLQTQNMGRYGIRHVVAEATRHLKFSRNHIDQILIYFALLAGLLILVAQLFVLIFTFVAPIFFPAVMAFSWFDTPDPSEDIAFNLLDRVFGLPDIFCSSVTPANCTHYATGIAANVAGPATGAAVVPLPYHSALHGLFRFYSTALMMIAVLIFLYFIVVLVLETAVSGTAFGQRFQNVWVPIRLVVALGLLMPINYGIGSGQYVVLYAAKYGSSFATSGWTSYNQAITSHAQFSGSGGNPFGERYTYLAMPEAPDITPLVETMSLVHACAYAYHRMVAGKDNEATAASGSYPALDGDYTSSTAANTYKIEPFLVKEATTAMNAVGTGGIGGSTTINGNPASRQFVTNATSPTYIEALSFYFGADIVIRFGEHGEGARYSGYPGSVIPYCGDVRIPVVNLSDIGGANSNRGGADHMLRFYYQTVLRMWKDDNRMKQFARSYVSSMVFSLPSDTSITLPPGVDVCLDSNLSGVGLAVPPGGFQPTAQECRDRPPKSEWKSGMIDIYAGGPGAPAPATLRFAVIEAWRNYVLNSLYSDYTTQMAELGWGGAGVWYNRIAEINGGWIDGVKAIPVLDRYPLVMEQVRTVKMKEDKAVTAEIFNPTLPPGSENSPSKHFGVEEGDAVINEVAKPLAAVYEYWNNGDVKNPNNLSRVQLQNVFLTAMNMLLGTQGLAAMRTSNRHLHPLAQLVAVGKGLVDSAIFDMAASSATAFLGGALKAFEKTKGIAAFSEAVSSVFFSLAFMGLTAGFVLFYILPFLPFIYFYFAVASWVKSIFESMVGVPLWALAHLRIDGDGLPGDAAQNGYFLIMEIFIRPILTVIGLIAAIGIFATQVRVLNLIWDLVAANTAGFTPNSDILGMGAIDDADFRRGIIDQFFFTIIYTIICYMMALASFKLIDKIPDNILRWAGAGVSSFGDIDQESIDSITRYATVGGMTIGNQAAGAIRDVAGGGGGVLGRQINDFVNPPKPAPKPNTPGD
ncbi:MAG: DotA/TraY family protein [Alphaproteobacteria bacterium]